MVALVGYAILCLGLYAEQNASWYFRSSPRIPRQPPPACPRRRRSWYQRPMANTLSWRVDRDRLLVADGTGLLALSYRGYEGSTGSPSETGLHLDADAAYAFAAARVPGGSDRGVGAFTGYWRRGMFCPDSACSAPIQ